MTFVHIRYAAIAKDVLWVQKVMRAEKIDFLIWIKVRPAKLFRVSLWAKPLAFFGHPS